jgi:RimJ/RimL family protein N-acetyltransferase
MYAGESGPVLAGVPAVEQRPRRLRRFCGPIEERIYELGFHLRAEPWGRGLAEEAGRALIDFGFETIGAEALFAGHHPENQASRRTLVKLGFRLTHEEFYPPTGLLHPSYLLERPQGNSLRRARE